LALSNGVIKNHAAQHDGYDFRSRPASSSLFSSMPLLSAMPSAASSMPSSSSKPLLSISPEELAELYGRSPSIKPSVKAQMPVVLERVQAASSVDSSVAPERVHAEPKPATPETPAAAKQEAPAAPVKSGGFGALFSKLVTVANNVAGEELVNPEIAGKLGEAAQGALSKDPK
jgi:hypothetical protein